MNKPIDPQPLLRLQERPGFGDLERARSSWGSVVAVCVWSGLLTGYAELVSYLVKVAYAQQGILRKSSDTLWEVPLADLGLFLGVGVGVESMARRMTRGSGLVLAVSLATLGFLAVLLTLPGLKALACLMLAVGLGSWIGPAVLARSSRFGAVVRWTLPLFVVGEVAVLGVVLARGHLFRPHLDPRVQPPAAGSPNVFLIVMDTVRFDATSLKGEGRKTTPFLESLASRGVNFSSAMAPAPWTLASHASMFTGRWPWELGVGPDRPLDARFPTLAEWMALRGYRSAGFVANTFFCSEEYGLGRGFHHYEDYPLSLLGIVRSCSVGWLASTRLQALQLRLEANAGRPLHNFLALDFERKTAEDVNRAALRWIEKEPDRPAFVFLNYFDVHDPYLMPDGASWTFGRPPASLDEWADLHHWDPEIVRPRSEHAVELARDAYDNCLAYLDSQIAALFASLEKSGQLENSVVIITSDHGEHFGEHSKNGHPIYGHGESTYQPVVHVPLLVVAPGRLPEGVKVSEAVSLRDLPATVLDLSGQGRSSPFPGSSLAPLALQGPHRTGRDCVAHSPAFSEFDPFRDLPVERRYEAKMGNWMQSVAARGYAYLRWGSGREALFRLDDSRSELTDIIKEEGAQGPRRRLRALLRRVSPEMPNMTSQAESLSG